MIERTISHYHIVSELGAGSMGVVYKAEDTRLRRHVALKFLPAELTGDVEAKAGFVREARSASSLDHPNICTVYEIDETPDGRLFIAMACYEGETLANRLAKRPLEVEEAVGIAEQAARGLAEAHAKGIVHRDVKPAADSKYKAPLPRPDHLRPRHDPEIYHLGDLASRPNSPIPHRPGPDRGDQLPEPAPPSSPPPQLRRPIRPAVSPWPRATSSCSLIPLSPRR